MSVSRPFHATTNFGKMYSRKSSPVDQIEERRKYETDAGALIENAEEDLGVGNEIGGHSLAKSELVDLYLDSVILNNNPSHRGLPQPSRPLLQLRPLEPRLRSYGALFGR